MKKTTFLLLLFIAIVGQNIINAQTLFFSEYIEGSGWYNKALEIYNPTDAAVDLADYVIRVNKNGEAWSEACGFPANTMIAANDVYVLAYVEADYDAEAVADSIFMDPYMGGLSNVLEFTGDDVRVLCKVVGTDTTIIDIIGNYDMTDPGDGWDVAGVTDATKNHTLTRKYTVTTGNADWTSSAGTNTDNSEWEVHVQDEFSYLGEIPAPPAIDAAEILSFVITEELLPAVIDKEAAQVTSTVAGETDLSAINPIITVSEGAQITATTLPVVFNGVDPVEYKVTAADGVTEKFWSVLVEKPATVTISEIQFTEDASGDSPLANKIVRTSGIVTAATSYDFYMQDAAGAWNGIFVYDEIVNIGDSVTVTGLIDEYDNLTEIGDVYSLVVNSSGNSVPEAATVTIADIDEAHESVLITIENATCSNESLNSYGDWVLADTDIDSIVVLDFFDYVYEPVLGEKFSSVTGVVRQRYDGDFYLDIRSADDVVTDTNITVTFSLDVSAQAVNAGDYWLYEQDVFYVTGSFCDWVTPGLEGSKLMIDQGNNIWTAEIEVGPDSEFKYQYYLNEGWENVDGFTNEHPENHRAVVVDLEDVTTNDTWGAIVNVGISEVLLNQTVIYPNPAIDELFVNNLQGVSHVIISNVLGQSLFIKDVTNTKMTINTSGLEPGVYVVTIVANNGLIHSERIIKE